MIVPDADPLDDSLAELPRMFPRPSSAAWYPDTEADLAALDLELRDRAEAVRLEIPPGALRLVRKPDGSCEASATWTPAGWLVPAPWPEAAGPLPPVPPDRRGLMLGVALLILAGLVAGLGLGAAARWMLGLPILGEH
jgi:hypothetical protein